MANIKNKTEQRKRVKENTPLTLDEKRILSEKSGYSIYSIDRILRGYAPVLPRHQKLIELYKKMVHLKQLHIENYIKDIKEM